MVNEVDADDDRRLIALSLEGDPDAFRALIRRHQDPIFDLCFRLLGNAQDAEDATQDAFVALYRHLGEYREGHKLSNWLYTIALNRCRRLLRRRKLLRFFSLDLGGGDDDEAPAAPEPAAHDRLPDAGLTQEKAERLLKRVLAGLPDTLREAFVLRYVKELSYQEIAQALSLSLANVKVRLHRAKAFVVARFGSSFEEL